MGNTVEGVAGASSAAAADPAATDSATLAEAFQTAVLQGGLFMLQTAMPDNSEDATVDPDAPF